MEGQLEDSRPAGRRRVHGRDGGNAGNSHLRSRGHLNIRHCSRSGDRQTAGKSEAMTAKKSSGKSLKGVITAVAGVVVLLTGLVVRIQGLKDSLIKLVPSL